MDVGLRMNSKESAWLKREEDRLEGAGRVREDGCLAHAFYLGANGPQDMI